MKNKMLLAILTACISIQTARTQTSLQSERIIPVYPGSELKKEFEPGDSKMCCSFVSNDGFDKVVSFYEKSLKLKSVDPDGLALQVPALRNQVELMKKEIKPGMRIRFFILKLVQFQGQTGAELFEVVDTGGGKVEFSVSDSQMSENDYHYADEWNGINQENEDSPQMAKPADTKAMVAALPAAGPAGYEKSELNINADPYNPASAGVDFSKGMDLNISITITDYSGFDENPEEMVKPQHENQKAVRVNGKYPGMETLTKSGDFCGGADKIFLVKNRYLVVISTMGVCDFSILNQLIEKMNIGALEK